MRVLVVVTFCIVFGGAFAAPSQEQLGEKKKPPPVPDRIAVFTKDEGGFSCFRIPSLSTLADGSMIAVAEGRYTSCEDFTPHDIVLKRSKNHGVTWGPLQVVVSCAEVFETGDALWNPTVMTDEHEVWILFNRAPKALNNPLALSTNPRARESFVVHSHDGGVTWSKPHNITAQVQPPTWTYYAFGTATGLSLHLPNQPRFVAGGYHMADKQFHAHLVTSTNGHDWTVAQGVLSNGTNENQVVVAQYPRYGANATLLMNARTTAACPSNTTKHCRVFATSDDYGLSWSSPDYRTDLPDPVCQGSTIGYKDILLTSNAGTTSGRTNLTLRYSTDAGHTWTTGLLLSPPHGYAGYSSLAITKGVFGTKVACLYEQSLDMGEMINLSLATVYLDLILPPPSPSPSPSPLPSPLPE